MRRDQPAQRGDHGLLIDLERCRDRPDIGRAGSLDEMPVDVHAHPALGRREGVCSGRLRERRSGHFPGWHIVAGASGRRRAGPGRLAAADSLSVHGHVGQAIGMRVPFARNVLKGHASDIRNQSASLLVQRLQAGTPHLVDALHLLDEQLRMQARQRATAK